MTETGGDSHQANQQTPSAERFVDELRQLGVTLPLQETGEVGVVADADGREILTLDVNRERPDAEIEQLALWIILAVNTCGGFKAVRRAVN